MGRRLEGALGGLMVGDGQVSEAARKGLLHHPGGGPQAIRGGGVDVEVEADAHRFSMTKRMAVRSWSLILTSVNSGMQTMSMPSWAR